MSLRKNWFEALMVLSATIIWVGCKPMGNDAVSKAPGGPPAHHEKDGHDHGQTGHPVGRDEEGPHHGHLIELGEEYHAELTHDEATKTVSIYVLDATAKKAVPIANAELVLNLVIAGAPQQVKLAAAPQVGDPAGQSSRFSAVDGKLLEALEAPTTTGHFNLTLGGKTYMGKIEHHDHDEHKHK